MNEKQGTICTWKAFLSLNFESVLILSKQGWKRYLGCMLAAWKRFQNPVRVVQSVVSCVKDRMMWGQSWLLTSEQHWSAKGCPGHTRWSMRPARGRTGEHELLTHSTATSFSIAVSRGWEGGSCCSISINFRYFLTKQRQIRNYIRYISVRSDTFCSISTNYSTVEQNSWNNTLKDTQIRSSTTVTRHIM